MTAYDRVATNPGIDTRKTSINWRLEQPNRLRRPLDLSLTNAVKHFESETTYPLMVAELARVQSFASAFWRIRLQEAAVGRAACHHAADCNQPFPAACVTDAATAATALTGNIQAARPRTRSRPRTRLPLVSSSTPSLCPLRAPAEAPQPHTESTMTAVSHLHVTSLGLVAWLGRGAEDRTAVDESLVFPSCAPQFSTSPAFQRAAFYVPIRVHSATSIAPYQVHRENTPQPLRSVQKKTLKIRTHCQMTRCVCD